MIRRIAWAGVLSLAALIAEAGPSKIAPEFRSAFEGRVRKGCYAVVTQRGIPTTSIYGVDGQQSEAYYSVDIKGSVWHTSQGLFDFNQVEADTLNQGEVMELAQVSVKDGDNRIDLRMVSVETHKVRRADDGRTAREPVSTNFKFFFPMPLRSRDDLASAIDYIGTHLRVFPTEEEARSEAARLVGSPSSASGGKPAAKAEIKAGMTPLEVLDAIGKPTQEVHFQDQSKWTYPDLTVVFEKGRVKEVRF